MGSAGGNRKTSARRIGVTADEYERRLAAGEKWCHGCKGWHPVGEFGRDRSRGDGLSSTCLQARTNASERPGVRERRRMAAAGLAWCRGCKTWLPKNDVTSGACRPHLNEEARRHYANSAASTISRKLARARGLDPIPPWWRDDRFDEFGGLCAYGCGRAAEALDHVYPVKRGGRSTPSNLVPACTTCNSSKKDTDPGPWLLRFADAFPDLFNNLLDLAYEHIAHSDEFEQQLEVA